MATRGLIRLGIGTLSGIGIGLVGWDRLGRSVVGGIVNWLFIVGFWLIGEGVL